MDTKKRILIVEDDDDIRDAIYSLLDIYFPDQVIVAEEGKQALDILYNKNIQVDIIITDINMPNGMGGVELLENLKLKSNPAFKVVLSGYIANQENAKIAELSDLFLEKPANLKSIVKIIQEKLN